MEDEKRGNEQRRLSQDLNLAKRRRKEGRVGGRKGGRDDKVEKQQRGVQVRVSDLE